MRKKINLMYIIESMNNGGAEMLAIRLSDKIDHDLFNPVICSLSDSGPLKEVIKEKGIAHVSLGKGSGKDLKLAYRLRRLLKEKDIHIVHTHNQGPLIYASLAMRFLPKKKLVHTEHINMETEISYSARHKTYQKILFRFLDGFISIAMHLTNYFCANYGLRPEKVVTIPNGINVEEFTRIEKTRYLLDELALPDDTLLIGNISALRAQKDQITLLKAMEIIKVSLPKAKLIIAGDGDKASELKEYSRTHDLDDSVYFLGYRSDTDKILSSLDIFVLPSLYEGLPLCLLEAMAAGIPVVATDVMGSNELVEAGENGLLSPAKSPEDLAENIITVLTDQKIAQHLKDNGRNSVMNKYNFDTNMRKYEDFYLKLLGRQK